jgi:tetratricopeptide (TPR) repeat protein
VRFLAERTGLADDTTRVVAILAVLSADGVSREMLRAAGQEGTLASGRRRITTAAVDDVLAALAERALLVLDPDGRDVVMPALVATVIRSWLAEQGITVTACRAAAAVLETRARTLDTSLDRPAARDFSEQVAALLGPAAGQADQAGRKLARDLLRLRFLALYYLIELGDRVPQAITAGEALTADLERILGADHPDTLNAWNSLGAAYLSAARPAEAIPLFERALVGLERTQGRDHPVTLAAQTNLAAAYQDAGRPDEAILLLRLTVAVRERVLGDAHPDTLNSCGNLAAAYRAAGQPSEAIPLLERTLAGREQALGADHPDTEVARSNLDQARQEPDRPPETLGLPEPVLMADPLPLEQVPAGQPLADQVPVEQPPTEPPAADSPPLELTVAGEPAVAAAPFAWESVVAKLAAAAETARQESAVPKPAAEEPEAREPEAKEPEAGESAASEPEDRDPEKRDPKERDPLDSDAGEQVPAPAPVPVPVLAPDVPRPRPAAESGPLAASVPARRRARLPWVAAGVVTLLAASGAVGALSELHGDGHVRASATAAPAKPADAAQMAADWVSQQVSRSVTVACDPLMCAALEARGVPTARLLVLRTGAVSPRGAAVVVATPTVRSQFGSRLDTEYAPAVIAGFGSGPGQVNVQVVAPDGAAAYRTEMRQDQAARKAAGTQLLANKEISSAASVRAQLAAGGVDSRLLILLPALAATHPIQVLAFGDAGPQAGPGSPVCSADLSGSGRVAGMTDAAYQRWLTSFIRAQLTRFTGSVVVVGQGGRAIVRVQFSQPSPLGLLSAA